MQNYTGVIPPQRSPRPEVLADLMRAHYRGDPTQLIRDVVRHPRKYGLAPEYLSLFVDTLRVLEGRSSVG